MSFFSLPQSNLQDICETQHSVIPMTWNKHPFSLIQCMLESLISLLIKKVLKMQWFFFLLAKITEVFNEEKVPDYIKKEIPNSICPC